MSFQKLELQGLRGFAEPQELSFAIPRGSNGSGLTILVGPNNGGKSTIVEALRALTGEEPPSFTEGQRNKRANDRVSITVTDTDHKVGGVQTVEYGGSETVWSPAKVESSIFILPSRRYFHPFFHNREEATREEYIADYGPPETRGAPLDNFGNRLFQVQKNRAEFDAQLAKVINPAPNWVIDQSDSGDYYLKVETGGLYHSSEGMGEGLVSLLIIIDALYDSEPGDVVVIDEPELSLHPFLQRRLSALLSEYAADRQIVIATHSPYFADFHALMNRAKLARIHLKDGGSVISPLTETTSRNLAGFLRDRFNPHVLGLDAREAFFLDDGVILVEGQEDVIQYQRVAEQLGIEIKGDFYGWGVGGAEKMRSIAALMSDLGFDRVVGLLDGDKEELKLELQNTYPQYNFHSIPANDIRTKPARSLPAVEGILDDSHEIRPQYRDAMTTLLNEVNGELQA